MALTVGVIFLAGLGVQGLGLLLHIVGLATPEWSVIKAGGRSSSNGLWVVCGTSRGETACLSYPSQSKDDYPAISVAAAFAIIGMIFGVVAVVTGLLFVIFPAIGKTANPTFPKLSFATAFAGFICVLICVIAWGAGFHGKAGLGDAGYDIGYSFGLSITGGILMAIGGGLIFYGKNQTVG